MPLSPSNLGRTLAERPLVLIMALAFLMLGVWAFTGAQSAELRHSIQAMDEAIFLAFRTADDLAEPIGTASVEEAMRDITALGGVTITTLLLLAAVALLAFGGKWRTGLFVLGMIAGGILFTLLLKAGFDRPRPDLVPHGSHVLTASFPSGHSATAAVVYLTLGALLTRALDHAGQRVLVMGLAVLITLGVGVSRVYLGVHWPTDVLAGWLVGGGWALAAWSLERALQRRHALEPPPPDVAD